MLRKFIISSASLAMVFANVSVVFAAAQATHAPTPPPVHHHEEDRAQVYLSDQALRPDSSALRIDSTAIDKIDDKFLDFNSTAKAGVESSGKEMKQTVTPAGNEWFHNPSVYAEYDYINSFDKRFNGASSDTNSAVIGFDFMTKFDILTGIIYSYSHRDAAVSPLGFPDNEDSHFISLYVAKSFWQWLNVGVAGGYGYTSTSTQGVDSGNEDTWDVSPFIGVSHSWGALSASLTTAYIQTWTNAYGLPVPTADSDVETGEITVTLKVGYAVTEKLKLQASAKYTGVTQNDNNNVLPESRNWATFGAKATYRMIEHLDIYAGYSYDAFNSSYSNNNVQAGVSYSW